MRIGIVLNNPRRASSPENATGLRHVRAYWLGKAFRELGVETLTLPSAGDFPADCDHLLVLNRKLLEDPLWIRQAKSRIRGLVCSIVDGCVQATLEDQAFFCLASQWKRPRCSWIGLAADGRLFQPGPAGVGVRVLVDHPHYAGRPDDSALLLDSLNGHGFEVKRLGQLDLLGRYIGPVSHAAAARLHAWADIFATTHRESLGVSVIEAALAGNLIVHREGHLKPAILDGLCCVAWTEKPDWSEAAANIDRHGCRQAALGYDRWLKVAEIIARTLG